MRKIKKRVATPVFTLILAGLLGLGNVDVKNNPNLPEPPQAPPIFNVRNSPLQPVLQLPESPSAPMREQEDGTCVSVHDGDTITVRLAKSPKQLTKVRLIGIDTPELKSGEFGETARDFTRSMLTGQDVKLVYDMERYDKCGRTLAYVYLKDGTFINARLLE